MRPGADSSHRVLFYDRDALLQLRECKNRLSIQPPSVPSMAIISNIRGGRRCYVLVAPSETLSQTNVWYQDIRNYRKQ
jgi:hypothetical protein